MLPSIGQVYLTEILDVQSRETLGSLFAISLSVGMTLTYILGTLFHWITVASIFILMAVLECICLYFIPESPHWLATHGFIDEAVESIKILRGNPDYDTSEEISSLQKPIEESESKKSSISSGGLWKEFRKPYAYKPLLILISLWTFQQLSGNYAVIFYAVDIFEGITHMHKSMMHTSTKSYISAILIGCIRVLGGILGKKLLKNLLGILRSLFLPFQEFHF